MHLSSTPGCCKVAINTILRGISPCGGKSHPDSASRCLLLNYAARRFRLVDMNKQLHNYGQTYAGTLPAHPCHPLTFPRANSLTAPYDAMLYNGHPASYDTHRAGGRQITCVVSGSVRYMFTRNLKTHTPTHILTAAVVYARHDKFFFKSSCASFESFLLRRRKAPKTI